MRLRTAVVDPAVTVLAAAYEYRIQYPAATLAYYGFVSLPPLLVLSLAFLRESVVEPVRAATFRFLTPEAKRLVAEALANSTGKLGATVFAVLVLAWSLANVTAAFESVVARVEERAADSATRRVRDAVSILASVGFGSAAVVAASSLFVLAPRPLPGVVLGLGSLVVALTLGFLPLYYVPTSELPSPLAALPGTVTVALGWTTLIALVRYYVANAAAYAIYGVLSGVLLVLTSLYAASVLLMLGFVVNDAFSDRTGPA